MELKTPRYKKPPEDEFIRRLSLESAVPIKRLHETLAIVPGLVNEMLKEYPRGFEVPGIGTFRIKVKEPKVSMRTGRPIFKSGSVRMELTLLPEFDKDL